MFGEQSPYAYAWNSGFIKTKKFRGQDCRGLTPW
jgi:hypothetical protein